MPSPPNLAERGYEKNSGQLALSIMKDKAIIAILSLCLVTCGVFGYQLNNIKVSETSNNESPAISPKGPGKVEQVLISADNVISTVRLESTSFRLPSGTNPFRIPARRMVKTQTTLANTQQVIPAEQAIDKIKLSGISWNSVSPLAVIDSKILKKGDIIPGSKVKIKDIQPASVTVIYQRKEYTLQFR